MCSALLGWVLLLVGVCPAAGWNVVLDTTTQASGAVGGEPFTSQPVISVNNKNGEIWSEIVGTVTARIHSFPKGTDGAELWKEGEEATGTVSQAVVDGQAIFTGLGIDAAGAGYQLVYVLYDEHGLILGTVIGDVFAVAVGARYQLGIAVQPEMAYGGSAFRSQPLLAIQDKGGNTVEDAGEGSVAVSLQTGPVGSTLQFAGEGDGFAIPLENGQANFQGLSLNEAGRHYSLRFSTDISLDGPTVVTSNEFSVGVGPAAEIVLLNDASGGAVFGGKAFTPQPRAEVRDAGGNVLVDDSSSAIRATFFSNPSKGKLLPASETMEVLQRGVVQFQSLAIDKAGVGYRLTYQFLQYEGAQLRETEVYKHGSYFNVEVGPAHQLSILQHSSGGWAGNQPFPVQPKVALLDAGGNVVVADSTSVVTAHVTPSLAQESRVIIDTSNDAAPIVAEVRFAQSIVEDARLLYGPGDAIRIDVILIQEVAVFQANDGGALPLLTLNAIDSGGAEAVYAELVATPQGLLSRTLSFMYLVQTGHSQTQLDYSAIDSLRANDFSIEDAFGRSANLDLPAPGTGFSLAASKLVGISDERPRVASVNSDLPSAEYGAGQVVNFVVAFDREVAVTGVPRLPLNVQSAEAGTPRAASYVGGSGTTSLGFRYTVLPGDAPTRLDVPQLVGTELLFPTDEDGISLLANSAGESPIHVDPSLDGMSLPPDQSFSIDTTPPSVVSITPQDSTTQSGTYAVGDSLFFEVLFDKPVEVDVGLELALNTEHGVARYVSGSGTDTLLLGYTVEEGDTTPALDFGDAASLMAHNTEGGRSPIIGHVRRKSTSPTTDANLDISHLASFTDAHTFVIDGERPTLLDVSFDENDRGNSFARGDNLTIELQFSAPVVVNESSPPLLGLLVGANERWATYTSGSGSSTLRFAYEVLVGDSSTDVRYRTLCHENGDCVDTKGLVVRLGATLELDADLITGFSEQGLPIADSPETGVTLDTSSSSATTVVSATASSVAGTYGVGEIVDIQVQFTDQVFVFDVKLSLRLNTGGTAAYHAGHETNTLTFRYISTESDASPRLDWALDPASNSAIDCAGPCSLENANGVSVDLRFYDPASESDLVAPLEPAIALDSSPPRIVSIGTDKPKSPYCHPVCVYTVGEEIDIQVRFDRPVHVQGDQAWLLLDVAAENGAEGDRAVYVSLLSTEDELAFRYTVGPGHSSNGKSLNYLCPGSLWKIQLGGATEIKGAASIPTLDADLALPPPSESGLSGDESNPVLVDASGRPEVTGVSSATANGSYGPGDVIQIVVEFSRTVVVSGEPFLMLDVGTQPSATASYKSGSGTPTLLFEYVVGLDHATLELDYVDSHSLHLGYDGVDFGSITQASTNPSINANLELAFPGAPGSLGGNAAIEIDSRRPFISAISATSGEYATGDEISIQVEFSRPVVVTGTPSLVLDAGNADRVADYKAQPDDHTLEFAYTVQLGDANNSLDYWSDEKPLPSSTTSFRLNDGSIRLQGTNATLDADLHVNPTDGFLAGGTAVQVTEGVAHFADLKVGQRGKDFKIWFTSNAEGEPQAEETIAIDASIEYEVRGDPTNHDPGDLYGSAVSLHGGMLAVGAPGKRNPTPEVQVLTVYSEASTEEHEIQIVATSVNRSEAVISSQEFSSCADAGEAVDGTFTLTYKIDDAYAFASPIELESDVSADQLKTVLEHELGLEGRIATSRVANSACEAQNAWTWQVTFLDSSDGVGVLETNGDRLVVSGAVPTRDVDMLRGSFQLANPFNGLQSRDIPYDASSSLVKRAIEEDLALSVKSVQAENNDDDHGAELGRRWTIIFSHHNGEYGRDTNVPQLQAVADRLLGRDARVWTHTGFEGRGVLSGSFAMSFRGSDSSSFVAHDSSEEEIAAALESLDSINDVTVSNRRVSSDKVGRSGVSWTITFDSVNKLTDYGWLLDPGGASSHGNLPPLEVTSHLIGWNAGYLVESETGRGEEDTQAQWLAKQMGDDGSGSGSVDIFHRTRDTWQKEATVLASDFDSNDAFGASVSIADEYLLVGAPTKEVDGLPEQQTLTCSGPAAGGFFLVEFRGFASSPIPFDATLVDIQRSIEGLYGGTDNVHSTPRLRLNSLGGWDGASGGYCEGSEASLVITFLTPDGGGISTVEQRSGDLEMVAVDASQLAGATISVSERRAGTVAPTGVDLHNSHPTGKQSGSAYLFQRQVSCSYCEPVWTQVQKFTPMDALDYPTEAAEFGQSSVFVAGADPASRLAVIGSPGYFHGSGKVYLFHIVNGAWAFLDSLSDQNWSHERVRGGRFGTALGANSDTILVGSPGHSNQKGAVYVFQRSDKGKPFLASQVIYGPDDLVDGDWFGHSVALHNNKAVLCAAHATTDAIHLGTLPKGPAPTGACYVYFREDQSSQFKLDQRLMPSNVLAGDRFGWSVGMTANQIVVGQQENASDKLQPPRPVQVVQTFCEQPPCKNAQASSFRLRWVDSDRWTPYLPASTSANQMREAIESSFLSNGAFVSRSELPDEHGGHNWQITFDANSILTSANNLPAIQCETFVTSSLSCQTHIEHDIPRKIRGKAHLFDFDEPSQTWTEQSFLFSHAPQKQDLLGASVAIDGNFVVAGAPNRELLNVNSGAALVYDVSFLNLRFPDGPYALSEGDVVHINVERSTSDHRQAVSLRMMDANADDALQYHVSELFSLHSLDATTSDKTPVELAFGPASAAPAMGRSQYYGSRERRSRFLDGLYDIQGINDYELLNVEAQFQPGEHAISTPFRTTDDSILESPDEHVSVQINLRGMHASQLGRLATDISIADNGDGVSPEGNVQYQVLDGQHEESARMGAAIDIDRAAGLLVVGSDQAGGADEHGNTLKNVGSAGVFQRTPTGSWGLIATLSPPTHLIQSSMNFGQSVAIEKAYGRDDVTVLVGAPGAASAFVYAYEPSTSSFALQATLTASDATLYAEDDFASRDAVALNGDVAFVGCSAREQVYAFRRSYVAGEGFASWELYAILRSSEYDFDLYGQGFTVQHTHQQGFGTALAAGGRLLLVGAPHADYGNRGDVNQREHVDTNGIHNQGLGKGKVYSFYSQPHVQVVTLQSDEKITAGSFRLKLDNHQGVEEDVSGLIPHNATPETFKAALEEMTTVGEVSVEALEKEDAGEYKKSWRISFLSSWEDAHPTLVPLWLDNGCEDCDRLKVSVLSTVEPFFTVQATHSHSPYVQEGEMQPRDVTSTDLFGTAIALDGPQAIIGSPRSAAKTRTTWNFETGDLQGWSATGTAFANQPTFGDNSKHRAVYSGHGNAVSHSSGESQSSRLRGRYYIATFEDRSGSEDSYQEPNPDLSAGSTQGDDPTGTLTSDPFIVRGKSISFLIGGGCDHLTSYVELLVDGFPSLRATGKCSERMDRVHWDVSTFIGRAAQIRIIDDACHGSHPWQHSPRGGLVWQHVNVDDFTFSWDLGGTNFGQCAEGGGALPRTVEADSEKQHYTGREESASAGAAYMFLLECGGQDFDDLSPSNSNCAWAEQERLVASDKREGNLFGHSVDIDHAQGIAIVGSPNSPAYGFYQEPISVHPHSTSMMDLPISESLEDLMKIGGTYSATGGNLRLVDYLIDKGQIPAKKARKFTEQAGSAYVFLREPAQHGPDGEIAQKSFWRTTEHGRFAPPDVAARDQFGFSVALDGTTATMGAVGRDKHADNGGGGIVLNMEWVRVRFTEVEFVAVESDRMVKIFLERDLSWNDSRYSLGYSTSDLTAVGVDPIKYDTCLAHGKGAGREGCGDYEQSSGVVTFNPGEQHTYFQIRIIDDRCTEKRMEYVQLNLHQTGGAPLRGEGYRSQIRIDDDDDRAPSLNCT